MRPPRGLALRLARRRLAAHPGRALALALGLGLAGSLPLGAAVAPAAVAARGARALAHLPLLVGPPGGDADLVLAALRLHSPAPPALPASAADALRALPRVEVLPLHLGHEAGGAPVVGVIPEHFAALNLRAAQGRLPAVLGEAVVGADLARARALGPGDLLRTDAGTVHDPARAGRFGLQVVGVLAPTGTAADVAAFIDLKTAWLLDGHLHGHADAADPDAAADPLGDEDLLTLRQVDDTNRAAFHAHGAPGALPVHLLLLRPADPAARDIALGELQLDPTRLAVRPADVLARLVAALIDLRPLLLTLGAAVLLGAAGLTAVVARLQAEAMSADDALLDELGAPPAFGARVRAWELLLLSAAAAALAAGVVAAAWWTVG